MNSPLLHRLAIWSLAFFPLCALHTRAITVPGADGSDGALNISANTVIDLSQAVTGTWNDNNSANAGRGIYDSNKWAVVFKYSSVNIAQGATVEFVNHASRAPVVWLVSGDVTIDGRVSLDGATATPSLPGVPGPGGFRGGLGVVGGYGYSAGFGPGGGGNDQGASYGTVGVHANGGGNISPPYGNPSLIPLIGGSGGHGNSDSTSGGAGAGALLIATPQRVTINGSLTASGGGDGWASGGGSGGALRLIAANFSGNGSIIARGGGGARGGGFGRIRLERASNTANWILAPDPSVVTLGSTDLATIFPPSGAPEVKILAITDSAHSVTKTAPSDPRAEFGSIGADIALAQTSEVITTVETRNVETNATVKVRIVPRGNADLTEVNASLAQTVSTSPDLVLRWTATLPSNVGYSVLQAHVIRP